MDKKPLVIFMVTNNYTPYSGGVVSALHSYTQELRALGHRVFIITLDFLGTSEQGNKECDVIRISCPLRFTYYKNPMAIPWRPTTLISRLVELHKPDIIHTHHPFLLGSSALKVAQRYRLPLVFTYHTMYEKYLHYIPLPQLLTKPVTQQWVKQFCNKVQAVVAPTPSLRDYLVTQDITYNISVIPSGILPHFIKPIFAYKLPSQRFTLLSVGRFMPEKNVRFLLNTYAHLDKTCFELVLVGYGAHLEELKTYAYSTLQLSPDDVRFIIKPSREELLLWYDKADLFIFASQTETQGLVLAEAMARGTPVVALAGTAIGDIVNHGSNGFIVHSLKEMSSTIEALQQDYVLHQKLQYAAWQTGLLYRPEICASQLVSLYNTL